MKEKIIRKLLAIIDTLEEKKADEFIASKLSANFDLKDVKKLLSKVQEEQ